jgi:geranylgeranyl diphosphate synthase type I
MNDRMNEGRPAAERSSAMIEAELRRWVRSDGDWMGVICSDAMFPAGKLLRPMLCLESALASGGAAAEVLPFAAGIECLHVASLVHDDILDHDVTRRGRESIPQRYGIDDAILAGDGLFAHGIEAMMGVLAQGVPLERLVPALRVVSRTLKEGCRAALLESTLRGDLSTDIGLCLEVIRGKTAVLMRAACEAGSIIAGASPAQTNALSRYGEALGMAFQIRDDLLPYTSHASTMGKAITSDIKNRQPNLPVLLAHALAGDADRQKLREVFTSVTDSLAAHREMSELLNRTGAVEEAIRRARVYATEASDALAELPPSESRDRLADLATTVIDRNR